MKTSKLAILCASLASGLTLSASLFAQLAPIAPPRALNTAPACEQTVVEYRSWEGLKSRVGHYNFSNEAYYLTFTINDSAQGWEDPGGTICAGYTGPCIGMGSSGSSQKAAAVSGTWDGTSAWTAETGFNGRISWPGVYCSISGGGAGEGDCDHSISVGPGGGMSIGITDVSPSTGSGQAAYTMEFTPTATSATWTSKYFPEEANPGPVISGTLLFTNNYALNMDCCNASNSNSRTFPVTSGYTPGASARTYSDLYTLAMLEGYLLSNIEDCGDPEWGSGVFYFDNTCNAWGATKTAYRSYSESENLLELGRAEFRFKVQTQLDWSYEVYYDEYESTTNGVFWESNKVEVIQGTGGEVTGTHHSLATPSGDGSRGIVYKGTVPKPPPNSGITANGGHGHGGEGDESSGLGGGEDSGCGSCASSSSETTVFGSGYSSVASLHHKWYLGAASPQESAGVLWISEETADATLATPAKLRYQGNTNLVLLLRGTGGDIERIDAPQGRVSITNVQTYSYEVRFFGRTGTNYDTSPFVTYTILNPNGSTNANHLWITEHRSSRTITNDFSYFSSSNAWQIIRGNGLTGYRVTTSTNGTIKTKLREWFDPADSAVLQRAVELYDGAPGFDVFLSQTIDPTGLNLLTTNTYDSEWRLTESIRPDGGWERYEYDSSSRVTVRYSAFTNQAPTATACLCRSTEYDYTLLGGTGEITTDSPRRVIEKIKGTEVARTYFWHGDGETREYRATTNNVSSWSASGGPFQVTTNKSHTSGPFMGSAILTRHPDGTKQVYFYSLTASNAIVTTLSGAEDPNNETNILSGSITITTRGKYGEMQTNRTIDIASGITTALEVHSSPDQFARPTRVDYLDGTYRTVSFDDCCALQSETDREGTTSTHYYDNLRRKRATVRAGITYTNHLDALGRAVAAKRRASNPTEILLRGLAYDAASRTTWSTNALGELTGRAYSYPGAGGLSVTTTRYTNSVSGPAMTEISMRDGSLLKRHGALIHGTGYEYGADSAGRFTKEVKVDSAGAATDEAATTYQDPLHRPYKTVYADGAMVWSIYNDKGQRIQEIDPDGVRQVFEFNAEGELEVQGVDLAGTAGELDRDGTDRIRQTIHSVTLNEDDQPVRRSISTVWATNNSPTSTAVATNDILLTGLRRWFFKGGCTNFSDTYFAGGGVRYETNRTVDGSTTISRFDDGRLKVVLRLDAIGSQIGSATYAYDAHGRRTSMTDARNGTTTFTYDNLDRQTTLTTPVPAAGASHQTMIYTYDALGRVKQVAQPDGGVNYTEYLDSGEPTKKWGVREYPVEYTYDYAGRMKTMKTWQNFAGNSGTAITTWNYDGYRGFMTNKVYADGKGPGYRYTAAGRLYQRIWARGVTTTYTTNAAGNVASIAYSDGTATVTYGYDRLGRLGGVLDAAGVHALRYDGYGNLIAETNTSGILAGLAVTNAYDHLNRRIAMGLSSDATTRVQYGYDEASRLATVTNGVNTATYSYIANSPLVGQIEFKQGVNTRMTTTKSYDFLNRLTQIASTPDADNPSLFGYTYNQANQRTRVNLSDGGYWLYQHDSLGQVTSGKRYWRDGSPVAGQQFGYAFDDIGNRKSTKAGGDIHGAGLREASYTVNDLNQYTERTVPGAVDLLGIAHTLASVTVNSENAARQGEYFYKEVSVNNSSTPQFPTLTTVSTLGLDAPTVTGNLFVPKTPEGIGHDADGNMTNDGRWALTWDGENRLKQMQSLPDAPASSSNRLTFIYDHQGRRMTKAVQTFTGGAWTITLSNRFLYDGWNLVAELNATNKAVINSFVWGLDLSGSIRGAGGVGGLLSITATNEGTHFMAYDGNGSVAILVSASSGTVAANYEYSPFGSVARVTGAMGFLNPFRFSTKYTDVENGFNYYGFRFFDSGCGRWVNRDPIRETGGANLYGFVNNSPLHFVDRLGLQGIGASTISPFGPPFLIPRNPYIPSEPQVGDHEVGSGSNGFLNNTAWFETHYGGWINAAKNQAAAAISALIQAQCQSHPNTISVNFIREVIPNHQYYNAFSLLGVTHPDANETQYGDSPQSFLDTRMRLGRFVFTLDTVSITWSANSYRWQGVLRVMDGLGADSSPEQDGPILASILGFGGFQVNTPDVERARWQISGNGTCCQRTWFQGFLEH
jgi:RHS repeat-associated protein